MEIDELIRRCKAITLDEGKESKVAVGNVMKGKREKANGGMLTGQILTPKGS